MTRFLATLAYRYRWPDLGQTHLPPGVGALMLKSSRLTGRWRAYWRWSTDTVWMQVPSTVLDRLPLCGTEAEIRALIGGGS